MVNDVDQDSGWVGAGPGGGGGARLKKLDLQLHPG